MRLENGISVVDFHSAQNTHHPLLDRYLPIFELLELKTEYRIECGIATYMAWQRVADREFQVGCRFESATVFDAVLEHASYLQSCLSPPAQC